MKLAPSHRIYALGGILLVALTICCRNFDDRGGPHFMAGLVIAGIAYLFAARELFSNQTLARRVVVVGLLLSAVWQLEFLRLPSAVDDDIHRYVWDGRLQTLGYNPFIVIPSDPTANKLHTADTRTLNNPDLPSPYPPGAQLFFRAVTSIHESTLALKIAFVLCAWGIVFLLLDLLRRNENASHLVLVYAWNPLLAIEVAGSGHVDIVGTLFLVLSVAALARRWRTTATVAFVLAVAVKFLPIVLLPLYWRRVRIRDAAIAAAVFALLYVPFLEHGRIPTGSIGAFVQGFRFNGPIFAALNRVMAPQLLAGLAVVIGLFIATVLRNQPTMRLTDTFPWPMAAALLFAPVVFPWYLLWLLPFLASPSTLLIAIWTVAIIPTYVQWHLAKINGAWGPLPAWVMWLEYGSLALAALLMYLCRKPQFARAATVGREVE